MVPGVFLKPPADTGARRLDPLVDCSRQINSFNGYLPLLKKLAQAVLRLLTLNIG